MGEKKLVSVTGPLGNKAEAEYGVLGDGETCIIEMACASGLALIPEGKLSPLKATTYGTGQLIKKALDEGFSSFILALGGSATNDGGAGMLQALGLKILDKHSKEIGFGGGELKKVHKIELDFFDKRIKNIKFLVASDVQNPLIGPQGASHILGSQKRATSENVEALDEGMAHWANEVEKVTGIKLHQLPGAGAGRVDSQTASGKTPMGVAQTAKGRNVPTVILGGSIGTGVKALYQFGVVSINSIINMPMTLSEAVEHAGELLELSAEQIVRSYFHQCVMKNKRYYDQNKTLDDKSFPDPLYIDYLCQ